MDNRKKRILKKNEDQNKAKSKTKTRGDKQKY